MSAPTALRVHEVAPRDGLQNEARILPLVDKIELVRKLAAATPASIEVASFVRADRIPQLADAEKLCAHLLEESWRGGVALYGLVPNLVGFARFQSCGLDGITVLVSATDGHSQANVGQPRARALAEVLEVMAAARVQGVRIRAYVSMALICPVEGVPPVAAVEELVAAFAQADADEVILADTLGRGEPEQLELLIEAAMSHVPVERLGLHLHDTSGRAGELLSLGLEAGIRSVDAAVGGCGGCPFAPGAAGNLSTEKLLSLVATAGLNPGMDVLALDQAGEFLRACLGDTLPS